VANLNQEQLRRLARLGAMARLTQIREEESAIRDEFPELFGRAGSSTARGTRKGRRASTGDSAAGGRAGSAAGGRARSDGGGRARRRKGMSPAARKAVSERMRKYWAERRKAKAK
jgi:hypothetical protein